jgi:hypothetical protein
MKRTVQQKFGKKVLLSAIVVAGLFSFNANAQTGYIGATAGAQYTTITSSAQNYSGGIGYNAAASFELRPSQKFGIELQAGYSTLTASTKYKDSIQYYTYVERFDNNYTYNTSFLQFHLLFKYYIRLGGEPITPYDRPQGSGNYLYFFAGPYGGLVQKVGRTGTQVQKKHINNTRPWDSSVITTNITLNDNDVQEGNDKNTLTNLDLGITAGAGVSLRLNSLASLDFTLRYSGSLLTIDNPAFGADDLSKYGFWLGHVTITKDASGKDAAIQYSQAAAMYNFIALNVGLKYRIFGDSY